ncbi:DNA repair protein RadA [Guggenheimella bovis]
MKKETQFVCTECGAFSPRWLGRCPECGSWNSFEEEMLVKETKKPVLSVSTKPMRLSEVHFETTHRLSSGINELDVVLGGGIVPGSLILVGGDPGIGKSTLLLQVASALSRLGKKVLYVSGEESPSQIRIRAMRLKEDAKDVLLLSETRFDVIRHAIESESPDILVVDSIQTMNHPSMESAPGSVSQVREVTSELMNLAKSRQMATFIVGHVTKAGSIAGPKILEHIVDTVLYFEGESSSIYRILRSVKNRFGSTNEVGIFEMTGAGLEEVKNPSGIFLSNAFEEPGTVIYPSIEGTRPLMVEIQSLVSHSYFSNPRRMTLGVDTNKLIMSLAVLEKKQGLNLASSDVYVNTVGGIQINEPALMLAMMASISSSFLNKPVKKSMVVLGEVGLLGEVRTVPQLEKRLVEAKRLGFTEAILPKGNIRVEGMKLHQISQLSELFSLLF